MSSASIRINTGQQVTTDYEIGKIFLFQNRYENDSIIQNFGYSTISLLAGTVMGRVSATGYLYPSRADANDGTQFPVGVLAQDVIALAAGATQRVSICIAGDVAQEKLIFTFGGNINQLVSGKMYRDRIQTDSAGIILRPSSEMTDYDN